MIGIKMKRSGFQKVLKFGVRTAVVIFAIIGFFLTTAFLAVKFHFTDDRGAIDFNDRYFQEIKNEYGKVTDQKNIDFDQEQARFLHHLFVLSRYYPENSGYILNAYNSSHNLVEAKRMLDATDLHLQDNEQYKAEVLDFDVNQDQNKLLGKEKSIFEWMNISEWNDFKIAVAKDKPLIDSVALVTGVEPRLIVSVLVGEQIRLFNSSREAYKKWIGPLKILSVETTFSLGVTGIKVPTAKMIEHNLKDSTSVYYLGEKYENLLDFNTKSTGEERFQRLTSYKNHYYSYLYAALNIKQIKVQWERAGYPIDRRPEILSTLYNIGFEASIPKENPVVGGSSINIKGHQYSFGAVAYEFYYSGELFDLFPFENSKFDFNDKQV
jgi:hypothetical protein